MLQAGLDAGRGEAGCSSALLIFFASPTATHALAGGAGARPRAAACRPEERAIEALIINVLLTLMAATVVVAIALQRNLFGVVMLVGHLQLPHGDRAGRARRGRRRDDRGVGRRRHIDRAAARRAVPRAAARRPSRCTGRWLPLVLSIAVGGAARLRHAGPARVLGSAGADPHACRAALPERDRAGDGRAERRHRGARELPRLRHARRDDGGVHRRGRRRSRCCAARRNGRRAR